MTGSLDSVSGHVKYQMLKKAGLLFWIFFITCEAFAAERPRIHFDQRAWQLGWSASQPDMMTKEYVLKGETADHWTEKVTIQFFPGLQKKESIEQVLESTKLNLDNRCPRVDFKILHKKDKDRLYEWSLNHCPAEEDRTEAGRLLQGNEGFYLYRYAVKRKSWNEKKFQEWMKLLNDFQIVDQ